MKIDKNTDGIVQLSNGDYEFDSGDGEQIKAFMEKYDKLIQDTIKASK